MSSLDVTTLGWSALMLSLRSPASISQNKCLRRLQHLLCLLCRLWLAFVAMNIHFCSFSEAKSLRLSQQNILLVYSSISKVKSTAPRHTYQCLTKRLPVTRSRPHPLWERRAPTDFVAEPLAVKGVACDTRVLLVVCPLIYCQL